MVSYRTPPKARPVVARWSQLPSALRDALSREGLPFVELRRSSALGAGLGAGVALGLLAMLEALRLGASPMPLAVAQPLLAAWACGGFALALLRRGRSTEGPPPRAVLLAPSWLAVFPGDGTVALLPLAAVKRVSTQRRRLRVDFEQGEGSRSFLLAEAALPRRFAEGLEAALENRVPPEPTEGLEATHRRSPRSLARPLAVALSALLGASLALTASLRGAYALLRRDVSFNNGGPASGDVGWWERSAVGAADVSARTAVRRALLCEERVSEWHRQAVLPLAFVRAATGSARLARACASLRTESTRRWLLEEYRLNPSAEELFARGLPRASVGASGYPVDERLWLARALTAATRARPSQSPSRVALFEHLLRRGAPDAWLHVELRGLAYRGVAADLRQSLLQSLQGFAPTGEAQPPTDLSVTVTVSALAAPDDEVAGERAHAPRFFAELHASAQRSPATELHLRVEPDPAPLLLAGRALADALLVALALPLRELHSPEELAPRRAHDPRRRRSNP